MTRMEAVRSGPSEVERYERLTPKVPSPVVTSTPRAEMTVIVGTAYCA